MLHVKPAPSASTDSSALFFTTTRHIYEYFTCIDLRFISNYSQMWPGVGCKVVLRLFCIAGLWRAHSRRKSSVGGVYPPYPHPHSLHPLYPASVHCMGISEMRSGVVRPLQLTMHTKLSNWKSWFHSSNSLEQNPIRCLWRPSAYSEIKHGVFLSRRGPINIKQSNVSDE